MNRLLLLCSCLLFLVGAKGQNKNAEIMIKQGDSAFKKGAYKTAINKYFAAEAFDPTKKDVVKEKVNKTFDAIEVLRKKAEDALVEAKRQTDLALEAKKDAEKQQSIAVAASKEATEQKDKAENINRKLQGYLSTVIGARYRGGIIAWKDNTGKHGLIAAEMDMAGGMIYTWDSAMTVCNRYSVKEGDSTYGGWHLPTIDEVNKLYVNKDVVGGFSSDNYWSSSEYGHNNAWYQDFVNGIQVKINENSRFRVRAVRAY